MAEVNPPGFLQVASAQHPAKLFRRILAGLAREGVCDFNAGNDLVVTAGGGMTVSVARGGAFVLGDDSTDQGLYFCYNDGARSLTIGTADGTNPRDDIIVARVKDNTEGQAGDTWELAVVAGTPAASPAEPALPATAIKLATVRVNAGASSISAGNITDRRLRSTTKDMVTIRKLADETVNNSSTLQDDDELQFSIGPGEAWEVELALVVTFVTALPDIKLSVVGPSGATGHFGSFRSATEQAALGSSVTLNTSAGTEVHQVKATILGGATAGLVKLQWAQGTPTAENTVVKAGSVLKATRIRDNVSGLFA